MRVIGSGDFHIKKQRTFKHVDRLQVTLQVLRDMATLAKVYDVRYIVLNGDLIDAAYPDLDVLLRLRETLLWMKVQGLLVYWVKGNHECLLDGSPNDTVLPLFEGVCIPVTKPHVIQDRETVVVLIPWHPNEQLMQRWYREAAMQANRDRRRKVLFSHVGLAEGRVAPSNLMLPQKISVADLYPDAWDAVLLSDYHAHQILLPHVLYMGSPIPHTFGDECNVGPWLVDLAKDDLRSLDLPSKYPAFRRWAVDDEGMILGLDHNDYNEIRCSPHLVDHFSRLYPTARVIARDDVVFNVDTSECRVRVQEEEANPLTLVDDWIAYRKKTGPDAEALKAVGVDILQRAMKGLN